MSLCADEGHTVSVATSTEATGNHGRSRRLGDSSRAPGPPVSLAVVGQVGERLGVGANAARITSAVFSAASGASGCPHTTARMNSGPTSRS